MKKILSGILAFLMVSTSAASMAWAEDSYAENNQYGKLENGYLQERQAAFDDCGMFQKFVNQYNVISYFVSDSLNCGAQYDKIINEDEQITLGFNMRTNNYAVFYTKTEEQIEKAREILNKYFATNNEGEYRTEETCFYVTDYKDECDSQKTKDTWDKIYNEMIEADLIEEYYYPGEVYEHHELYVPYLTKYLKKQTSNPDHSEPYTEEELRNYVEENKLPLTVKYVKEKTSEYYYLVPDEEIDFNTHFDIATQLWNDLHITPYAYDDGFKSNYPTFVAKKGDGNADGIFNISDVLMTMKYLISDGTIIDKEACDMNLDGTINVIDFSLMKNELIG